MLCEVGIHYLNDCTLQFQLKLADYNCIVKNRQNLTRGHLQTGHGRIVINRKSRDCSKVTIIFLNMLMVCIHIFKQEKM